MSLFGKGGQISLRRDWSKAKLTAKTLWSLGRPWASQVPRTSSDWSELGNLTCPEFTAKTLGSLGRLWGKRFRPDLREPSPPQPWNPIPEKYQLRKKDILPWAADSANHKGVNCWRKSHFEMGLGELSWFAFNGLLFTILNNLGEVLDLVGSGLRKYNLQKKI